MKLKINDKEYVIKYGYKPTLKSRITSRVMKMSNNMDSNNEGDSENEQAVNSILKVEDMLMFLPELLLVGLQKYHKDEYGYDYDTGEGKADQLDRVCDLIDDYLDIADNTPTGLYTDLQHELFTNSFLSKMLDSKELSEEKVEALESKENQTAESQTEN